MDLSQPEIARIREIARRVRIAKERDYDGTTWEQAKLTLAKEASESPDEYYKTLALLEYFLDEGRALCSLQVFLEGVDVSAENLRARDKHYAIDGPERDRIRTKVDAFLNRVGAPSTADTAFDFYQVLIDRVFTSTSYPDLLDTIARLGAALERWYPRHSWRLSTLADARTTCSAFPSWRRHRRPLPPLQLPLVVICRD